MSLPLSRHGKVPRRMRLFGGLSLTVSHDIFWKMKTQEDGHVKIGTSPRSSLLAAARWYMSMILAWLTRGGRACSRRTRKFLWDSHGSYLAPNLLCLRFPWGSWVWLLRTFCRSTRMRTQTTRLRPVSWSPVMKKTMHRQWAAQVHLLARMPPKMTLSLLQTTETSPRGMLSMRMLNR